MENSIIKKTADSILPIIKKYNITQAGLFGSIVRDDFNDNSDIDILVNIEQDISLLDFIGIKQELEEALKRKVDLVEYNSIKPVLRDKIIREEIRIL